MAVTALLAIRFFMTLPAKSSIGGESAETSALTGFMFIMLAIAVFTLAVFAIIRISRNPRRALKILLLAVCFALIMLLAWIFGSDRTVEISGYEGNQNTAFWMRLTDVWLLSIAALLCISSLAMLAGIIWSKTKKRD